MINYQLPNGRTIQISFDSFLKMTDEDISKLNESHIGHPSDNPFDLTLDSIEPIDEDLDLEIE